MIRPTAYCDECGRAKAEGNHWFRAILEPARLFFIVPWDEDLKRNEDGFDFPLSKPTKVEAEIHLCSESCAVKAMSKAIGAAAE